MTAIMVLNYWIVESIKVFTLYCGAFFLGHLVIKRNVKVNYTRKIIHFITIFLPPFLISRFPYESSFTSSTLSTLIFLLFFIPLIERIRSKSSFLSTVFASVDRPEDRPHTLIWGSTQILASYTTILLMVLWLAAYDRLSLINITILVVGLGDGLAEPVGISFGKHKYKVRGLFVNKTYTRSVEGSMCVLLMSIIAIMLFRNSMNSIELVLALIFIPAIMTLTEAFSPHTWDGPFLIAAGGITTIGVIEMAEYIGGF